MPPIACKLHSLNDLPKISLVKTVHVTAKNLVLVLHSSGKKTAGLFGSVRFGSVTITVLVSPESHSTRLGHMREQQQETAA